mgnify:CR=1 FL=1
MDNSNNNDRYIQLLLYSYISTCAHQGFYFNFTVVARLNFNTLTKTMLVKMMRYVQGFGTMLCT